MSTHTIVSSEHALLSAIATLKAKGLEFFTFRSISGRIHLRVWH